jgi:hypothetical protein
MNPFCQLSKDRMKSTQKQLFKDIYYVSVPYLKVKTVSTVCAAMQVQFCTDMKICFLKKDTDLLDLRSGGSSHSDGNTHLRRSHSI